MVRDRGLAQASPPSARTCWISCPRATSARELSADAGYCTEGNLRELSRRHIGAYVATGRQRHGDAVAQRGSTPQPTERRPRAALRLARSCGIRGRRAGRRAACVSPPPPRRAALRPPRLGSGRRTKSAPELAQGARNARASGAGSAAQRASAGPCNEGSPEARRLPEPVPPTEADRGTGVRNVKGRGLREFLLRGLAKVAGLQPGVHGTTSSSLQTPGREAERRPLRRSPPRARRWLMKTHDSRRVESGACPGPVDPEAWLKAITRTRSSRG